jgi:excisionase family DNA binding protein
VADDYYTTGETARILGLTEGRIRQLLLAGELEGERDPLNDRWRIPQHAVHARKEQSTSQEVARRGADAREWMEKVELLRQELGRVEGRLELTAQAESTLRENLEREREALGRERERADRLEEELREERSKGSWARLFGG